MNRNTPQPTGEYAVGTFTFTVFNDREETLYPGKMRSVPSRVYYPVDRSSVEGLKKHQYMSREMASGLRKVMRLPVDYDKAEARGENISECYLNAPAAKGKKFPLIVFSCAYGSFRESNSYLCIDLVSHGYVVILVGHPYETVCAEFDDGTCVYFDSSFNKRTLDPYWRGLRANMKMIKMKGTAKELSEAFDAFQRSYSTFLMNRIDEWVKDTKAAVRYARENLGDLIDFSAGIGASGHSYGGDTAYRLCTEDPDFVCGINMDGALFGDYTDTVLDRPFMQISCRENEGIVSRVYLKHSSKVYKVVFDKMKHLGFSDMKYRLRIGFYVGKLDADVAHENMCRCHLEFFDAFLKKIKPVPELTDNEAVTITEYPPDMTACAVTDRAAPKAPAFQKSN